MGNSASGVSGRVLQVLGDRAVVQAAGTETDKRFALVEITSQQGGGPPLHRHPWREGYWVIEGDLEFVVDGKSSRLTPGAWLLVQPRTVHTMKVLTPSARYLLLGEPAGVELFFTALHERTAKDPANLTKIVQIAEEHGIELAA